MFIVCFDVCDSRRLRAVARTLEDHGRRVQRSVFECHLEADELDKLKQELEGIIDPCEDHIRYYSLCGKDISNIVIDGTGEVTQDSDFHLV